MHYFVYATLTNSHQYTNWITYPKDTGKLPTIDGKPVFIKGGANLATSPESKNGRFTPRGVCTEVTESQMEYLERNKVFQKHKQQGLIVVMMDKEDADVVARKEMAPRDNSAPLTPTSPIFQKDGLDAVKPSTAKEHTD